MKILVVVPPYVLGENSKAVLPNKAMLPIGPLVIAGQLRARGHQVEALDLVFEGEWRQALPRDAPDILLCACHTPRNIPCCAAVLDALIKVWGRRPHTVLGGNSCLHLGQKDFAELGLAVDAVARGFGHTQNVIKVIENRLVGDIKPVNVNGDIPAPALDLLPQAVQEKYLAASGGKYPLNTSSGCDWYKQCGDTYCAADMDSPFMPRSAELVYTELALAHLFGYRHVWLVDNVLFANQQAIEFAPKFDGLVCKFGMTWSGMTRVERICQLPQGFLEQLVALTDVAMGVETASEDILQDIARTTKRHQILQAFRMVREAGKSATAFVILDLPKSTDQDFWRLVEFLEDLDQQAETTPGRKSFNVSMSFYNPPVQKIVEVQIQPADMGFYRWPMGCSTVPQTRAVQHAMLLFGRFWKHPGWHPSFRNPFWETETEFGVNFLEGRILQERSARDPAGDLSEVWMEEKK